MAKFDRVLFSSLYVFLNILCTLAELSTKDYLKRENSLIKPYSDGRWDFIGSTIVTSNYVRLTPDHQSRRGGIWNSVKNTARSWELHVHFKVHGAGTELYGDGMALWYTKEKLQQGPVFGAKDYFIGLGVFLDTYSNQNGPHNHGHPYISAMVSNGSLHYDHDRDGTHTELAGCETQFRRLSTETYLAIRYEKNRLTVSTDIEGLNTWKQCFSVDGVRLPTGYYFGASAATGDLADIHDIISVKLYDIGSDNEENTEEFTDPSADFFAPPRDHSDDPKGMFTSSRLTGWRLLMIIILGIIGLGVCAMVGFIIFTKRQEDARKRFY